MKRGFGYAVLLAILAAIFAVPAISQTGTVKGVCKDAEGKPIADAQVVWHNTDNGRTFNLKTDKKGGYFSVGLDPGKYTITLSKDGKDLDSVKNYQVHLDENTLDFDIKKAQEESVQATAKQSGLTPEQIKQMQEDKANAEKYNANIQVIKEKVKAVTAALQPPTPDYEKAIALLDECVSLGPGENVLWSMRGVVYMDSAKAQTDPAEKTKRYTSAYNDLQKAVELKKAAMSSTTTPPKATAPGAPTDKQLLAGYYENLASSSAKIGKTDEAIDDYKQAIDLYPAGAAHCYLNMGIVITISNRKSDPDVTKQAVDAFDKAIAADPTIADAYYFKGNALMGFVKMDSNNKIIAAPGTAEAFQKYLELKPDGPYAAEVKNMLAALGSTVETNYGTKKKK